MCNSSTEFAVLKASFKGTKGIPGMSEDHQQPETRGKFGATEQISGVCSHINSEGPEERPEAAEFPQKTVAEEGKVKVSKIDGKAPYRKPRIGADYQAHIPDKEDSARSTGG